MSGPPPPSVFAQGLYPLLAGSSVACPLYGIAIVQTIHYYRTYPEDSKWLKYYILALMYVAPLALSLVPSKTLPWLLLVSSGGDELYLSQGTSNQSFLLILDDVVRPERLYMASLDTELKKHIYYGSTGETPPNEPIRCI
ncbi:hypothetical protein HGRIS_000736 [Hohenbuehelia grisea]|uniref:Uncharacterized protein n=1 Tax=Hohenbuehelia grisea TaxID=104357 RepID=A0ABR3IPJ9_9AGAR